MIQTEGFPGALDDEQLCVWTLTAPLEKSIMLDFLTVALNGECDKNFIEVFDIASGQGRTKVKFSPIFS